ncbi:MAG: HigA family addiction module antidote protein [Bacteroidales bacterium]|nr:HigA family addiction module antidote protein [Bacteroidales bacterium]
MAQKNQYLPPIVFHPGETLAERLDELGMGPKEFAVRTGKPEKTITAILTGRSSITPEMAVQFEKVLQIPANFWTKAQRAYDEYKAREKRAKEIKAAEEWLKYFPVRAMINKGWVKEAKTKEEKTEELLGFFAFSSHNVWENYYYERQLKVEFRISLAHTKEPHAISAWLRRGDIQASKLQTNPFDSKAFKELLPEIKNIMVTHPDNFFEELQKTCLKAGVKVVYTPCLPKAPINGSTRWLSTGNPVIQLSDRWKRNDIFWFTFFHEAGHILLHGKKDIFLEDIDYSDKDMKKEKEADDFAVKWTFTEEQEQEVTELFEITEDDIIEFAEKFNTHPAMIIGRLQKKKIIHYSVGRDFIVPIEIIE